MHHDEDPIPLDMARRIVQKSARDAIKAHQEIAASNPDDEQVLSTVLRCLKEIAVTAEYTHGKVRMINPELCGDPLYGEHDKAIKAAWKQIIDASLALAQIALDNPDDRQLLKDLAFTIKDAREQSQMAHKDIVAVAKGEPAIYSGLKPSEE